MTPPKFKPRVKRDKGAEALTRLRNRWNLENEDGEWDSESEPVITPMLKSIGIPIIIEALRMHDDPDARNFMETYDRCTPTDRSFLRLEDIAFASGIGSLRLAEIAQTALFIQGQLKTNMLMAAHLPSVVEKSLRLAKTTKGLADREWMLKAGKILPIPKGSQTVFVNNVGEKESEGDAPEPMWRSTEERLKEFQTLTDPKRLPSPESKPFIIGGHVDHMQAETVEIIRGDNG